MYTYSHTPTHLHTPAYTYPNQMIQNSLLTHCVYWHSVRKHIYIHTPTPTHLHTYIHSYTYKPTHSYTYTHTYTHTYTQPLQKNHRGTRKVITSKGDYGISEPSPVLKSSSSKSLTRKVSLLVYSSIISFFSVSLPLYHVVYYIT